MKKRISCLCIYSVFILINSYAQEENIQSFGSTLAVNFSINYNFLNFIENSIDQTYRSNRPVDLGIGATYKKFIIGFSVALPFAYDHNSPKTDSYNFYVSYFGSSMIIDLSNRNYRGFYLQRRNGTKIRNDLELNTAGISWQYIFDNKNHSPRAAYKLRERQIRSAGGLLAGVGIYYTAINSHDDEIEHYKNKAVFWHIGPTIGYTYSWIFKNDFFTAVSFSAGVSAGIKADSNGPVFSPLAIPRLSAGRHFNTWSCTLSFMGNLQGIYVASREHDFIFSGQVRLLCSKRL